MEKWYEKAHREGRMSLGDKEFHEWHEKRGIERERREKEDFLFFLVCVPIGFLLLVSIISMIFE